MTDMAPPTSSRHIRRQRIVAAGLIAIVVVTVLGIVAAGSLAVWLLGWLVGG